MTGDRNEPHANGRTNEEVSCLHRSPVIRVPSSSSQDPAAARPQNQADHRQCSRRSRRAPSGQREPRRSRGASWVAITRQGIVSPRRSPPSRGVGVTTPPNQPPRVYHPARLTSTPVSSSRHSSHRSSVSAHTAGEIICVVSVAANARPEAVAVALADVADALKAGDPVMSPSR